MFCWSSQTCHQDGMDPIEDKPVKIRSTWDGQTLVMTLRRGWTAVVRGLTQNRQLGRWSGQRNLQRSLVRSSAISGRRTIHAWESGWGIIWHRWVTIWQVIYQNGISPADRTPFKNSSVQTDLRWSESSHGKLAESPLTIMVLGRQSTTEILKLWKRLAGQGKPWAFGGWLDRISMD